MAGSAVVLRPVKDFDCELFRPDTIAILAADSRGARGERKEGRLLLERPF